MCCQGDLFLPPLEGALRLLFLFTLSSTKADTLPFLLHIYLMLTFCEIQTSDGYFFDDFPPFFTHWNFSSFFLCLCFLFFAHSSTMPL